MSTVSAVLGTARPVTRALYDVAQLLEATQNAETRVRRVLTLLGEMVPYDQCVLLCATEVAMPRMTSLPPLEEGPASEVSAALDSLLQLLRESASDQAGAGLPSSAAGALSGASHLAVPLVALNEVIGILAVWQRVPDAYGEVDVGLLSVVAAQLASYMAGLTARDMLDRMVAAVAHDLGNPLMSISGVSQFLQRHVGQLGEPERERFAHGLKTIETTTWSMTTQLNELLDYARAQTGRLLDLDTEPTDVVALLRQTVDEYQRSTERHTLVLQTAEETIVTMVDPRHLGRAVASLLVNAIKYSPEGGQIVVSVSRAVGIRRPVVEHNDSRQWARHSSCRLAAPV